MSKIQIWKRITTISYHAICNSMLYLICQRYKFESESQPPTKLNPPSSSCIYYVKDTNLKANHNFFSLLFNLFSAVFNMSKIQIWKRITTAHGRDYIFRQLYLICQRYKFESESQRSTPQILFGQKLYLICQRYKFESESQLFAFPKHIKSAVFNMSKIQIWKRITTPVLDSVRRQKLYLICQRYKFESESQPVLVIH